MPNGDTGEQNSEWFDTPTPDEVEEEPIELPEVDEETLTRELREKLAEAQRIIDRDADTEKK